MAGKRRKTKTSTNNNKDKGKKFIGYDNESNMYNYIIIPTCICIISLIGFYIYYNSKPSFSNEELNLSLTEIREYIDTHRNDKSQFEYIEQLYISVARKENKIHEEWWNIKTDTNWIIQHSSNISLLVKSFHLIFERSPSMHSSEIDQLVTLAERIIKTARDLQVSAPKDFDHSVNPQIAKMYDSLIQYYTSNNEHKQAIYWIEKALLMAVQFTSMSNRWKGFLLQELILSKQFFEAKQKALKCISDYKELIKTQNHNQYVIEFPYFCYHQLGSLYTMDGNHKQALDIFLQEYAQGIKDWRHIDGQKCEKSRHLPISLENFHSLHPNNENYLQKITFISNLIPSSYMQHFLSFFTCSSQQWPYFLNNQTNILDHWNIDPSQSMRCITSNEKQAIMYKLSDITVIGKNKWIIEYKQDLFKNDDYDCSLLTFSFPYTNSIAIPRYIGSNAVPWNQLPVRTIERALLVHFVDYNYYHLSIEVMAQIILAIQQNYFMNQNNNFVILITPSPLALKFLEFLGFESHAEPYLYSQYQYQIHEAFIVDWKFTKDAYALGGIHDGQEYYLPPAPVIHMVREFVLGAIPSSALSKTKQDTVVFIHRNENSPRGFMNYEHLYKQLEMDIYDKFGYYFTVHYGEDSLLEQILLFRRAVAVIGVHGAGLSNLIYCQSSTIVIEIPAYPLKVSVYSRLASMLNFDYWVVPAGSTFHYDTNIEYSSSIQQEIRNTVSLALQTRKNNYYSF